MSLVLLLLLVSLAKEAAGTVTEAATDAAGAGIAVEEALTVEAGDEDDVCGDDVSC